MEWFKVSKNINGLNEVDKNGNFYFYALQAANPFFKLLTMLMEFAGGPPGMPPFASYILQRIWEVQPVLKKIKSGAELSCLLFFFMYMKGCYISLSSSFASVHELFKSLFLSEKQRWFVNVKFYSNLYCCFSSILVSWYFRLTFSLMRNECIIGVWIASEQIPLIFLNYCFRKTVSWFEDDS